MLHDPADFAVFAFADGERDPDVVTLFPLDRCLDRAIIHLIDGQASRQLVQLRLIDLTVGADPIAP